jgi:HptB-dependent secretion and biofilm anti anti-sigma factor
MDVSVLSNGGRAVIRPSGRFDFNSHREFRSAVDQALQSDASQEVQVDLSQVTYLDSSALGMLLVLRDKAREAKRPVVLCRCRDKVREVLEIANFSKLFTIS